MMSQPTEDSIEGDLREHARRITEAYSEYVAADERYADAVGEGTLVTDSTGQAVVFPSSMSGTPKGSTKVLLDERAKAWKAVTDSLYAFADTQK